jgi:hypothetical protein
MKLDYASLEIADTVLINSLNCESPVHYLKALESMCRNGGWTLAEYWNTMLSKIDAGWDSIPNNHKLLN